MDSIPEEIFQIILSYYTNRYQDLIRISRVSKYWKNVSDHCFVWQICELKFSLSKNGIIQGIELFSEQFNYRKDIQKVVIYESREKDFLARKEIILNKSFQENCFSTRNWFIQILSKYKRLYATLHFWRLLSSTFQKYSVLYYSCLGSFWIIAYISGRFVLGKAINTNGTSLDLTYFQSSYFFMIMYIICFIYFLFLAGETMKNFMNKFINPKSLNFSLAIYELNEFTEYLFFFCLLIGGLFTILLIQWKIYSSSLNSWLSVLTPMWVANFLAVAWIFFQKSRKKNSDTYLTLLFVSLLSLSIPTSCSMIAMYYDRQEWTCSSFFYQHQCPAPVSEGYVPPTYYDEPLIVNEFADHYWISSRYLVNFAMVPLTPFVICLFIVMIIRIENIFQIVMALRDDGPVIMTIGYKIRNFFSNQTISDALFVLGLKSITSFLCLVLNGFILVGYFKSFSLAMHDFEFIAPQQFLLPLFNIFIVFHGFLLALFWELQTIQEKTFGRASSSSNLFSEFHA